MTSHLHAIIMAGGTGTRFWPLSRRDLPKQFLAIGGEERNLLQLTYDRLLPLVGPDRVLVAGSERHRQRTLEELPGLPPENFLGEPAGRNTAPCIGLAAHWVRVRDPDAVLLVVPADHAIRPDTEFHRSVRFASDLLGELAQGGEPPTVMLGIPPQEPATGYGYVEQGALIRTDGDLQGHRATAFKEKPDLETARRYIEGGRFLWNSGIFLWTVGGILRLIEKYLPDLARGLESISKNLDEPRSYRAALDEHFASLPSISIDYGVLEHATNVAIVRASFSWSDLGSWKASAGYLPADASGNRVRGRHVGIDTRDCVVFGDRRLVTTLGVEGLVIVDTEDSLLVCRFDEVERVRELVEKLKREGHEDVL